MDDEVKERYISFIFGKFDKPGGAANLIAFLASEKADWISGQIIHSV